jgi:hypothetical protein
MSLLVLTNIPHFLSIIPPLLYRNSYTYEYTTIVMLSTTLSTIRHCFQDLHNWLIYADMCMACIWVFYDVEISYKHAQLKEFQKIIMLNNLFFLSNLFITLNKFSPMQFAIIHSIWHIFSACKSYYVSSIINERLHKLEYIGSKSKKSFNASPV